MTTLIHTSPDGPSNQQFDLLTAVARCRSRVVTLDSSVVDNVSSVAGLTVTAALNALRGQINGPVQSQIGWAPATLGTSNVLTLVAAGHAPGLYEICPVTIIRTTATGTGLIVSASWTSPGGVVEALKSISASSNWSVAGTVVASAGTAGQPPRSFVVNSDGSAAITVQWLAGAITGGAPVADLYACARLVGLP